MEVLEPEYTVIHESLLGAGNYSIERVLDEVGEYLGNRTEDMRADGRFCVTGALDGVLEAAIEPGYNPAMSYKPNRGVEVNIDEDNGLFKFEDNVDRRYWVPYIEGNEICVFTDHFQEGVEGDWDPLRFSYSGQPSQIPELSDLNKDIPLVYGAFKEKLADFWNVSLAKDRIQGENNSVTVDYSSIYDQLLQLQKNEDATIIQRTMEELRKISDNPDRHRKIIQGQRIFKPTDSYRLAGNLMEEGERVLIKRFGHRKNFYSEGVDH